LRCTCWPLRGGSAPRQARSHMALQAAAPVIDPAPVGAGSPAKRPVRATSICEKSHSQSASLPIMGHSVHITAVALVLAQRLDIGSRRLGAHVALLGHDLAQRRIDILGHVQGIATDIEIGPLL